MKPLKIFKRKRYINKTQTNSQAKRNIYIDGKIIERTATVTATSQRMYVKIGFNFAQETCLCSQDPLELSAKTLSHMEMIITSEHVKM